MSLLCLLAYAGVSVVVLALLADAVRSVSARPVWRTSFAAADASAPSFIDRPPLQPVEASPVDPRHSGFAGLANEADWKMTA